jgi:hypothetical protein
MYKDSYRRKGRYGNLIVRFVFEVLPGTGPSGLFFHISETFSEIMNSMGILRTEEIYAPRS